MPKKVNKDLCIGCGMCVGVAPDTFSFDDDGKAVAADVEDAAADEAMASCPVGAIEEA